MSGGWVYIVVGVLSGVVSGSLGVGGGTIMVPLFVLAFGMSQHDAQGTALAVMLPPVFILAVWRYYAAGHVKVAMAVMVALGFLVGAFLGAQWAQAIPAASLRRYFGGFLLLVGLKMILGK